MPLFDNTHVLRSRAAARSGGDVWSLIEDDQKAMVASLRGLSRETNAGPLLGEAARWFRDGVMKPVFRHSFSFSDRQVVVSGPDRWGFLSPGVVDTSGYLSGLPVLVNRTGGPRHLVTSAGQRVRLENGGAFDAAPDDNIPTIRVNGRVAFIPQGVLTPDPTPGASELQSLFGGSKILGLRTDRITPPSGIPGVVPASPLPLPENGSAVLPVDQAATDVYVDENGYVVFDESGLPVTGAPGAGQVTPVGGSGFPAHDFLTRYLDGLIGGDTVQGYVVMAPHTIWTIPNPSPWVPATLDTSEGILCEGTGFVNGEGCIHLFRDPASLWPDRVCHIMTGRRAGSGPKGHQLRSVVAPLPAAGLSSFRRRAQSHKLLFRAACDAVGLEVASRTLVVRSVEHHPGTSVLRFDDGSSRSVAGPCPRRPGDIIMEGETLSGLLTLRCESTHGPDWFKNRPWGLIGVDARLFWRGAPAGLLVRDASAPADAYSDPVGGGLRARMLLLGDGGLQDTLWSDQAAAERLSSSSGWAETVFGFSSPGDTSMVNPLAVAVGICGGWAAAVEGALGSVAPEKWRLLLDFLEESKPAGAVIIPGPTYFF